MDTEKFTPGYISYEASAKTVEETAELIASIQTVEDGFMAFSNQQERIRLPFDPSHTAQLLQTHDPGGKGYLMELDLWGALEGGCFEISIEFEDSGFFVQQWRLDYTCAADRTANCYYRWANTFRRGNTDIFSGDELRSIEVIYPERRLHFFITR